MKNALFYLVTVLIWGSTWLGIKLQLGVVDPMVSVTYPFALASALLLSWCVIGKMKMRFTWGEHGFMLLQGMLLFGFNYLFLYKAELYITSGLAAVLFSTILVMDIVNGAVFLGSPIDGKVVIGGGLGLLGIILVFLPEISHFSFDNHGVRGIALCLLATLLFPLVALAISTVWEGYAWSVASLSGVALILIGNLCILVRKRAGRQPASALAGKLGLSGETA